MTFQKGHLMNKGKNNPMYGVPAWNKGRMGEESHSWRGGINISSKGYVIIYKPEHPYCEKSGYILEHRLVVESQIKRYLKPKESCHHFGKKTDNRPHMLMAFSNHSAHQRFHWNPDNVRSEEIIFDGRTLN